MSTDPKPQPELSSVAGPYLTLNLIDGGQAQIVTLQGEQVTVSVPRPYPPGAWVTGADTTAGVEYRVKVKYCSLDKDSSAESPRFFVKGRLVNLSKYQRRALGLG